MFTRPNLRTTIAAAVAAVIGTAGLVGAAATNGGDADQAKTAAHAVEVVDQRPGHATADGIAAMPTTTDVAAPSDATAATTPTTEPTTVTPIEPTAVTPTGATTASAPVDEPVKVVEASHAPVVDPAELDEPAAPGEPGVVSGPDHVETTPPAPEPGPTELLQPVPKPEPPKPAIPGPADLLPGNGGDPDPTPHQGPSDFQVTPLPGHLGNLSSGLTGCQLECVTRAQLISNDFHAGVVLEIDAKVPVHAEIEITTTGTNSSKHFNKAGYATEWAIPISPLQPKTTYDLKLIVIDEDGHSRLFTHQFTTVDIVEGLTGNAQGCALHCITKGAVHKTDHFSTVQLQIETDSPARYDVWVSTSEPGTIGNAPILPIEAKVYENADLSTSATFDVTGLQPDTVYHVIARAEDSWGVDHRVGTFRTDEAPPIPVTVTFEQIRVTYDGDKGALNRGELSFRWGFDGVAIGHRGEEKMHAGTDIALTSHNSRTFLLPADGWSLPWFGVSGAERDWDGKAEFCAAGLGVASAPFSSADCDTKTNVARTGDTFTEADLAGHLPCNYWGFTGAQADHTCVLLVTPDMGDDYAQFTALVRIAVG